MSGVYIHDERSSVIMSEQLSSAAMLHNIACTLLKSHWVAVNTSRVTCTSTLHYKYLEGICSSCYLLVGRYSHSGSNKPMLHNADH